MPDTIFPNFPQVTGNMQEVSLDGVIYARFEHNGPKPGFWEAPIHHGSPCRHIASRALMRRIWFIWPGRAFWQAGRRPILQAGCYVLWSRFRLARDGRSLYDNFPAARKAMDYLADIAGWDILGLMDETDLETISQTREADSISFHAWIRPMDAILFPSAFRRRLCAGTAWANL